MANRKRAEHIQQSKVDATKTLAKLLLFKSGLSAQDLQDLFEVGEQTESASEFAIGDYWNKAKNGAKTFSDDRLARVAHLAVARGFITFDDVWQLELMKGGPRILRSVYGLLVDSKCGVEPREPDVIGHHAEWKSLRKQRLAKQSRERVQLEKRLRVLCDSIASTSALAAELLAFSLQCEAFEVSVAPSSPHKLGSDTDENTFGSLQTRFREVVEALIRSCEEHARALSKSVVEESFAGEVGDLPESSPKAAAARHAIEEIEERVLSFFEKAVYEDEDQDCEIHIAEFTDYVEPIAAGQVVRLLWTERASSGSEAGRCPASAKPTFRPHCHKIATAADHL